MNSLAHQSFEPKIGSYLVIGCVCTISPITSLLLSSFVDIYSVTSGQRERKEKQCRKSTIREMCEMRYKNENCFSRRTTQMNEELLLMLSIFLIACGRGFHVCSAYILWSKKLKILVVVSFLPSPTAADAFALADLFLFPFFSDFPFHRFSCI